MLRAAILTISDKAHAGLRDDTTGPSLRSRLDHLGWAVTIAEVLPDDAPQISLRLSELADARAANAIFTAGGTGVAARDVTPEATRAVIDKEIPGMAEQMRAEGLKKTPLAVLSRAVVGTRGGVLIVNLPGSPKGALESLDAIVGLIPHVVDLLEGRTEHPATPKRESCG